MPAIAMKGGEWIAISNGLGSNGMRTSSSWYLLRFEPDSTAQLSRLEQGNYVRECVAFSQKGNVVTISGSAAAPQLNDIPLTLNSSSTAGVISKSNDIGEMTFFHRNITWPYIHFDLLCFILIALFFVWCQSKMFNLFFVVGGIFVLLKYWSIQISIVPFFMLFEAYAVFNVLGLFWLVRFTALRDFKVMHILILAVLSLSVLVAAIVDFGSGLWPNILNGLAGILCVLSIKRLNGIGIIHDDSRVGNQSKQSLWWVVAFSIWNTCFVYLNFNEYTSYSIAVNAVSVIIAIFVPGAWLLVRTFTTALFYIYLFTFHHFALHQSFIPISVNETIALIVSLASLGLNLALCAYAWCWKGKPPGFARAFKRV